MTRKSPVEANDRHTALPGLRWPGGRHVAVVLNVAYEVWSQGQVSGVGPMGNPLPAGIFDTNADSYGRYGAVDGIRRLMRKLEQAHATADIFTSGALAERESQLVKAIADAGHGIIGHGYTQDIIHAKLSSADDKKYVRLATKLLTEVTGRQPTGWVSPRATPGPDTARHLAQLGYKWQCDSLDADLQETAFLLVAFCKRCRSLVFFERSGEIRLALKVILFGIVVANEGNPQSRNRRGGIETGWIRCVVERQFRRIPPFDVISEIRPLLLG